MKPTMHTLTRWLITGLLLVASLGAHAVDGVGLQELDEDEMNGITAQQGIAVSLEYRINAKEDGEPVDSSECPTVGALTGGASCRLALNYADRDGMWIVLKGYRGILFFKNVRLDAVSLPGSTVHRDLASYMGGYDPNNKPAIRLTSGNWARATGAGTPPNCEAAPTGAACRTYMNQPNYNDFTLALNIDSVSMEFDSGGTPGYLRNAIPGAAVSMRFAHGIGLVPDPDNPPNVKVGPYTNDPALVRLDGRLQIHGFGF